MNKFISFLDDSPVRHLPDKVKRKSFYFCEYKLAYLLVLLEMKPKNKKTKVNEDCFAKIPL